ncbi:MAG: methyltransferase domain-containing protein [Ruminococcaceae bacterium]|nr:methyltransferase domain-containing protein [Oscillospiraceae bacterium]
MTGFLATTFPESKIVSIDRSSAAIEMARGRIETLGATNVEFRNCSLEYVEEQYDTVFCMRTIQENIDYKSAPFEGEPILYQYCKYGELTKPYTQHLLSCLKENGYPIIDQCRFGMFGINSEVTDGWVYVNLGMGNHLIVRQDRCDGFAPLISGCKSPSEIYQRWLDYAKTVN